MPIRYPIAFRGTARPSVCSAWRLKVPKIERLTHPKPYIVPKLGVFPKPFAYFSLICSFRNPISCRNSVFFRNLLFVSALFAQGETLYRAENPMLCRNLLLVSALFAQAETLAFHGTWSGCASAGNLGSLSSSAKLASLFRHFLPFRFWAQLRRFCVCEKPNINICLHIPQRSGGRSRQQGQGGRGVFIKTG